MGRYVVDDVVRSTARSLVLTKGKDLLGGVGISVWAAQKLWRDWRWTVLSVLIEPRVPALLRCHYNPYKIRCMFALNERVLIPMRPLRLRLLAWRARLPIVGTSWLLGTGCVSEDVGVPLTAWPMTACSAFIIGRIVSGKESEVSSDQFSVGLTIQLCCVAQSTHVSSWRGETIYSYM